MKNDLELHVSGIIRDTENGKGKLVYLVRDSFDLISKTFAAKKFNKDNQNEAGVKRMESPLQFSTGIDSEGTGTYVFPFSNATLYVQFRKTTEVQKDAEGNDVVDEDGNVIYKTVRDHILTTADAEAILTPVEILI